MGNRRSRETRQTVLKPLGLVTTPNPYGRLPPGSLSQALNCTMRRPGELEAAPKGTAYTPITAANSGDTVRHIQCLDDGYLYNFVQTAANSWTVFWSLFSGGYNATQLPTSVTGAGLFKDSRVQSVRSRDRMLCNSNRGVLVVDDMTPSNAFDGRLRYAGLPQPGIDISNVQFVAGSPIPNQIMIAYAAVITREFSDGYIVKSVPSIAIKVWNPTASGTDELVTLLVDWNTNSSVQQDDFVEVYRTDGILTTSLNADPGGTFKLVYRYKLTATDTVAGNIVFDDNQPMTAPYYQTIGKELYTNPYQEGSTGSNRQPDVCGAMATFKGFAFYGNLTERPQFVLNVAGGINDTVVNLNAKRRASGVGGRSIACTVTNGSPTVTGVSTADKVGIVVGQVLSSPSFPANTTVQSIGATTITMSANATSNGTSVVTLDVLELNGTKYAFGSARVLAAANKDFEITPNQTLGFNTGIDVLGLEMSFEPSLPSGATPTQALPLTITARATNGQNYSPQLPSITQTVATISAITTSNLLRWSKDSEPEHVPSQNETRVGSGQIIAMVGTKDALWIGCTDGIYRLSGTAGVWRLDIVAPACVLCSPRCMVNNRETVYAYTNLGFGAITDSGFVPIGYNMVREQLPGTPFAENAAMHMGYNLTDAEVYIHLSLAGVVYIYNVNTNAFTTLFDSANNIATISAFAWQDNPQAGTLSGVIFGLAEAGLDPALISWGKLAVSFLDVTVRFNPFYAGDAFVVKQWIDVAFMFMAEAVGYSITPFVAGSSVYPNPLPIVAAGNGSEGLVVAGVRRSSSLYPKIIVGFNATAINTTNRVLLYGVSLRYVPLTYQLQARQ